MHGYALCVVLGVLAGLSLTERRYRAVGGRPWLIVDIATYAAPAALVGARIYRIITDFQRYFGHGRDWVGILRIWDGGLGLPGAAAAGIGATWLWCRRHDIGIGPVLVAAAPGISFGAAISLLGNWFAQSLYGPPSTAPWAVPISPASRVAGYQDFGTFQPLFVYEAAWDVTVGLAVLVLIRRMTMTGDRALALCIAGYAIGMLGAESFVLSGTQQHAAMVIKQLAAVAVLAGAGAYVYLTRAKLGPEPLSVRPRRRSDGRSDSPASVDVSQRGVLGHRGRAAMGSGVSPDQPMGSGVSPDQHGPRAAECPSMPVAPNSNASRTAGDPPRELLSEGGVAHSPPE